MFADPAVAPLLRPARPGLLRTAALTLLASGAAVATAVQLATATTRILTGTGAPWWPLLGAGLTLLLRAVLLWLRDLSAHRTGTVVVDDLRLQLLDHVAALGPGHQWPGGAARAHLTVVEGCEHLRGYIGSYIPQKLTAILVPAVLVVALAVQDLLVALTVVATVALVPLAQTTTRGILGERAQAHWLQYEAYGAKLSDSVAGLPTLASMGAVDRRSDVMSREAESLREATTKNMNASLATYIITGAAMLLGTAGATVQAAWHAAGGDLSPGAVVLVLYLSAECFRPLQDLQSYWHEGFYGLQAARSVRAVLEEAPPVADTADAVEIPLDGPPTVRVEGVTFTYPGAERPALSEVSASFPAGQVTALVGASGSGKTTLTSLLLRDVDPDHGSVLVAGRDLRSAPLAQVRRLGARVSQDVVLLDGTVEENVRCALRADGDADQERLLARALEDARVTEFLDRLPNGPDSPVDEGGRLLSGGQRQRVALARALVQRSPLLVLDEATSALDGENEALITEALRGHDGSRTIVVIAHRLSTVAHADHVVVLDHGRVVEEGDPAALAQTDGWWARMVRAQQVAHTAPSSADSPALDRAAAEETTR